MYVSIVLGLLRATPPGWIAFYPGQNRGYWMASPQGWGHYCHYRHLWYRDLLIDINSGVDCPLPRTKPGLLNDQPPGLVDLLSLSSLVVPDYWKTRGNIGIPDTGGVSLQ
ncbi:MAG: hypothetical protein ACOXZO_11705 [Bacteroidales bacterium]